MNDILRYISLAYKARKVISGEDFVTNAIRKKMVKLVFLASDAGKNTTKKIIDKTNFYQIDLCITFSGSELSNAIGKENRKVIGITDAGFSKNFKIKGCECYGKKDKTNRQEDK